MQAQPTQPEANALAYQQALQLASKYHWEGVYNLLMQDGFSAKTDYVALLELWHMDSALEEDMPALFI